MSKYVSVTITRQTKAVSQKGFGMPLILSTEQAQAYKEYAGDEALASIGTDYGEASETYKVAASILGQTPRPEKVAVYGFVYGGTTPAELSTELNTLQLEHDDWFYLVATEQGDPEITELSTWVKAQEKLYFASTSVTTLAATLQNQNAIILVHDKPEQYPAEAWAGYGAPQEVGSFTWTFKTLNGITPALYDVTTIAEIEDNNASAYIKEGGVNITSKGVTTSGDYIDIMQSQYYLKARMIENVFGLLARSPKVPFTDAGISLIVAEVEKTLKDGFNNGIIADEDGKPLFEVSAPTRSEVSTNDKANRTLPDVNWTATIAGAVESVKINGVLKL